MKKIVMLFAALMFAGLFMSCGSTKNTTGSVGVQNAVIENAVTTPDNTPNAH